MINIIRNEEAPANLINGSIVGTKEALLRIFHGKCYICERKDAGSLEIEHFKPQNRFPELSHEWNNLFLACHHCNSIKGYTFDRKEGMSILDCTDENTIIKDLIHFECNSNPKEKIEISSKKDVLTEDLENTIELLDNVFNSKTESKKFDAKFLTNNVTREMKKLLDVLHEYTFDAHGDETITDCIKRIKNLLSPKSPFTAFKISHIMRYYQDDAKIIGLI